MILVICSDLFFKSKIQEVGRQLNQGIEFCNSEAEALEFVSSGKAQKVIVDLNDEKVDSIQLIQKIRLENSRIPVIGFLSHVQAELKEKALKAGFSMVVPRSAFSKGLAGFLSD